jgi:predicted nucleotidyltransferase
VQLALDELVQLGLVARLEGGRDFLVSLNRRHRLASALEALFRVEAEHFLELRGELLRVLHEGFGEKALLSLVLFGSAARAEDRSSSDLDLLLIAADSASLEWAMNAIADATEGFSTRFGVTVRPIGYSLVQARRLWRQRRAPLVELHRDGIPLLGPPLRELLGDED